ncbi:hypothetical protein EYF80_057596 [Liparis tanakae]|uniref:Uncharacterized protein n=1 Tax=Liparis tanakae TaxID=230148 RepID=A0A4Z2ETK9_9TELE|nr:hypothetical protein EYF80_057596 [Liparis tanakae]
MLPPTGGAPWRNAAPYWWSPVAKCCPLLGELLSVSVVSLCPSTPPCRLFKYHTTQRRIPVNAGCIHMFVSSPTCRIDHLIQIKDSPSVRGRDELVAPCKIGAVRPLQGLGAVNCSASL